MRHILLIIALSVFFICCKKNNNEIENIKSSEYFPDSVGNYWKYKIIDNISNSSSVVEVNIVGNKILPGGLNSKIWTYNYSGRIDTSYVYQRGDTIRFFNSNGEWYMKTYVVPLQLNNNWRNGSFQLDSVQVKENRTYNLGNQNFENSFLLVEKTFFPNDFIQDMEWFCPNVGIVTISQKELYFGRPSNISWELLEYRLR